MNTLNEEARISFALRSVRSWVDEIVVVDMHSDDRTRDIAESFGARVFTHERAGYADPARQFAVAQATGDWILVIDADELVTEPLSRRLREIAESGDADAVSFPWRNYLLGGTIGHTGWGPNQDRHIRFFRRSAMDIGPKIHRYLSVKEGARVLDLPATPEYEVAHFNYADLAQFVDKLNRYTGIEAGQWRDRGDPASPPRALWRFFREFGSRYVRHRGFRDGWRGFYLSFLMGMYKFLVVAKADEYRRIGTSADVEGRYRDEAERVLSAYDGGGPHQG
jgi:glycosyltransferase involved in cell wall biosynthesis